MLPYFPAFSVPALPAMTNRLVQSLSAEQRNALNTFSCRCSTSGLSRPLTETPPVCSASSFRIRESPAIVPVIRRRKFPPGKCIKPSSLQHPQMLCLKAREVDADLVVQPRPVMSTIFHSPPLSRLYSSRGLSGRCPDFESYTSGGFHDATRQTSTSLDTLRILMCRQQLWQTKDR